MTKTNYLIILQLIISQLSLAQFSNSLSTASAIDTIHPHEKTIYYALQRSWIANQEPSYLSIMPHTAPIDKRRIPLIQSEGANSNFDLVEANINLQFPLFFGRRDGKHLSKTNRITFDYNGTFRMTLDDSKPLTPSSHKIGFSWYLSMYNNQTGWFGNRKDDNNIYFSSLEGKNLNFINFLFKIHHYSDGQAPGFYYFPIENDSTFFRNNYINGDFSTNYVYFELTKGIYKKLGQLYQFSFGYRHDLGTDTSTFAFSKEQENSYGRNRLFLKYDYHSRRKTIRLGKKRKLNYHSHFRIEIEQILGDMSNFQANLINDGKKYRTGIKTMFELAPANHRAVGYFISGYYGRDYLNIRYDDVIYSIQAGLTLNFDKYFAPNK